MDKPIEYRKVDSETFRKFVSGMKTCWLQRVDRDLDVNDRIVLQEVRGDLITGRALEIAITGVEVNEYCPEGFCLISFQPVSSLAKIAVEVYFGLFAMFAEKQQELAELEKKYNELLRNKEVIL